MFLQRKLVLTVSIIFLLFPRPPIVIVLELALRRRGAGATGGIGGGRRDIVVDAASASLHCEGKNKAISSPNGKLGAVSLGKYRVHDGQPLVGVLLLAQRPLQRRRHGFREAGQRLGEPESGRVRERVTWFFVNSTCRRYVAWSEHTQSFTALNEWLKSYNILLENDKEKQLPVAVCGSGLDAVPTPAATAGGGSGGGRGPNPQIGGRRRRVGALRGSHFRQLPHGRRLYCGVLRVTRGLHHKLDLALHFNPQSGSLSAGHIKVSTGLKLSYEESPHSSGPLQIVAK